MEKNKLLILCALLQLSSARLMHTQAQICLTPSFCNVINIQTNCNPGTIVKADFNGDGKLDIVVQQGATGCYERVSVFTGNGNGFESPKDFAVKGSSRFITTGDFNRDDRVDLVFSNYYDSSVSILLGYGDGSFGEYKIFSVGSRPWGVAVGDFNGDKKQDLAVTNSFFDTTLRDTALWKFSDSLSILLGDGMGGFDPATSVKVGNGPISVVAEDFNGDGKLDLAVANNFSFNICILLGNGKGKFSLPIYFPVEPGGGATCVATGDFNGDKRPDLAVSNFYQDDVSILLNNGAGRFAQAKNYPVGMGVYTIGIGDLNNDSKSDLVISNLASDNISVLLGNGNGGFGPTTTYLVPVLPHAFAIGDFNNDGNPDLVTPNLGSKNISILWGDGSGGFVAPRSFPAAVSPPLFISKSDFNRDGNLDLVTVNAKTNNISVTFGDGKGGFGTSRNFSVGDSAQSVAIGDFNGDGDKDLAVANFKSNNVSVLLGDGNGQFSPATNFPVGTGPCGIATSDFNGDGNFDLAITNSTSNNLSILLSNGNGTFSIANIIAVGTNPRFITIGDFNDDGEEDLAVANYGSNNVFVLVGNGTGTFVLANTMLVGSNPSFIITGDFNSNGKPDLAVTNWGSNTVSILLGNGDGSFNTVTYSSSGRNPRFIDIADLNKDNKPDLVAANWGTNNVSILLSNNYGGFSPASTIPAGRQTSSIAIGDFDNDGYPDLAISNYFSSRSIIQPQLKVGFVSIFLNIEKPKFFVRSATPDILFPPNHKMVDVALNYWAIDNCPEGITYQLLSVTSNEPDYGLDDEDIPGDIVIVDEHNLKLRAERSDLGDGRIYTATLMATDGEGNSDISTIPIVVSKNAAITQSQKVSQEIFESNISGIEVSVRPNPTESSFSLLVKTANQTERITLQVFDQSGRLVETRRLTNELTSRIGSMYSPGVYFLRVIQGREHKEVKVLKHS